MMPKILTPSEVRAYNNHRLSEPLPDECIVDLFVTIGALAEALRATENWRASGKLYSKERNACTRVAAWLED